MKRILTSIFVLLSMVSMAQEKHVLTLDDCRNLALENSPEMKKASLTMTSAEALKAEARWLYLPNVSMSAYAFAAQHDMITVGVLDIFGKNELGYNLDALWDESYAELGGTQQINALRAGQHVGISLFQPVFTGGRIVGLNRLADLTVEAAGVMNSMSKRQMLESVEKNYFLVSSLQMKQKWVDKLQSLLDTLDTIADVAYGEKVVLKSDMLLLDSKKMEFEAAKLKLKTGMRLAKMNLLNSTGIKYRVLELDDYEFPVVSADGIPSPSDVYVDEESAVGNLEESRLLSMRVDALETSRRITLGGALPQVGIGASYGYNHIVDHDGRWNGSVYAGVSVPITGWGRTAQKLKRNQASIDKAIIDRDHYQDMLVLLLRKYYMELESAWDAMNLAKSQLDRSEYLYEQAQVSYDAGYSTIAELLQVYANLFEAEDKWSESVGDYMEALQAYVGRTSEE